MKDRIENWKSGLAGSSLTQEDIEELTTHLQAKLDELAARGFDDNEAWLVATHSIGSPKMIDQEFSKVNPDFVANRTWMMMLWGAIGYFLLQTVFIAVPAAWYKFYQFKKDKGIKGTGLMDEKVLETTFWCISATVLFIFIIFMWKGKTFSAWLNKLLSSFGAGFAFLTLFLGYMLAMINYGILRPVNSTYYGVLNAFEAVIFTFYASLFTATAYFTLRYQSGAFRTLNDFRAGMSWKAVLVIALMSQVPVQFTHGLNANTTILTSILIYTLSGWMVSKSTGWKLNLVILQLFGLFIYISGMIVNDSARVIFTIYYAVILASIGAGFILGRYTDHRKPVQAV